MEVTLGENELPRLAEQLVKHITPGDIVLLFGPLAAGKTTLVRHLAAAFGYFGQVTSPTFVLERIYPLESSAIREIAHLDFYRLSADQLKSVAWQEYLGAPFRLTIIEWPEVALNNLPLPLKEKLKTVTIEMINARHRRYRFSDNFIN